jgi:hypothetical protein
MRVRVVRTSKVPAGQVSIEDVYQGDEIVEIVIRFNLRDLKAYVVEEFSDLLTKQAAQWAERAAAPDAEWHSVDVMAQRRDDLPQGVLVAIKGTEQMALYLFAPVVIEEAAAQAFARGIGQRAATWVRVAG